MQPMSFTILGNPKALMRHRTYTRGKGGRPLPFARQVDPSKGDKADFLAQCRRYAPDEPWTGPVDMAMMFVFARPKDHFRTGKHADEVKGTAPLYHTSKPDLDNLAKLVKDALNGVFYRDDSQIVLLHCRKRYGRMPRTEVELVPHQNIAGAREVS